MEAPPDREDYHVAIICALGIESKAVTGIFDKIHETSVNLWCKTNGDHNAYTTGRIGKHNVVLTYMPGLGKANASTVASTIKTTFRNIALALVVGICGGAPCTLGKDTKDIHLGDVVISTEIKQTDLGRNYSDSFIAKTSNEGNHGLPARSIQSFLSKLQNLHSSLETKVRSGTQALLSHFSYQAPDVKSEILYDSNYLHKHHESSNRPQCRICSSSPIAVCDQSRSLSCQDLSCDTKKENQQWRENVFKGPAIHFGPISSTDTVLKNGAARDALIANHKVIAFEMEGAGVSNTDLPTIVVKGVCDFADSHKNKDWQEYAAITAAAGSRVLLEEWTPTSLGLRIEHEDSEERQRNLKISYLDSLNFREINLRLHNIKEPHPQTCTWIFDTLEFQTWLNAENFSHRNHILWIKGKPGSGKSTIMKHIYHAIHQQRFFAGRTLATFFFHARGSEMQKNMRGLFQSLLHQLMRCNTEMLDAFVSFFPAPRGQKSDKREWTAEELQTFLLFCASENLLHDTVVLIDALDECGQDEARELADLCENLALNASVNGLNLSICLSIRRFPNITMDDCVELHLDNAPNHQADIQRFVWDKICVRDQVLVDKICKKAQHVFLWTVLAIRTLKKAFDEGKSLQDMLNSLEDLPSDMHAIFQALLRPSLNIQTRLMLQLVLYAREPLSPSALYCLVMAGTEKGQLEGWRNKLMTKDRVGAFITTSSKGLLEVISRYGGEYHGMVQFIHESVRDYLLDKNTMVAAGLNTIVPIASICHMNIAKCCLAGMFDEALHDDVANHYIYEGLPHLRYAINNVLRHLCNISDLAIIENLLQTYAQSFKSWGRFTRIVDEINAQFPGNALVRIVFSDLAYYKHPNSARILGLMVSNPVIMQLNPVINRDKFYQALLRATVDHDWIEGIKIVLHAGAQAEDPALLDATIPYGNFWTTQALLSAGANPNAYSHEYEDSFLCLAIDANLQEEEVENMVGLLLDYGADPNARYEGKGHDEALTRAVENQHLEVISILIKAGAKVSDRVLDLARKRVKYERVEFEAEFDKEDSPDSSCLDDLRIAENILYLLEQERE